MTATYSNTRRPVLMKWLMCLLIACGIGCLFLDVIFPVLPDCFIFRNPLLFAFVFCFGAWLLKYYKLQTITIDEENGFLINSRNTFSPMKISEITTVKYEFSWRGRYRCLCIRDQVRFFYIHTSRFNAVRIRNHLKKLNPTIKP